MRPTDTGIVVAMMPSAFVSGSKALTTERRSTYPVEVARRQILEQPFTGPPWTISVVATVDAAGAGRYQANVFLGETFITRIVLDLTFANKIAAEVALTVAARKWVSEYEGTVHSGSTDFGELHG